jgi:Protein of unknown function (DUF1579)
VPEESFEALKPRFAEGESMSRKFARTVMAAVAAVALTTLAVAQQGQKQPEMTPEQKAEMEAYMKAGTPGGPHLALAAFAGNYDLKIKSWHEPGAPALEDTGTATRSMALGGRVLVEEVKSSMMGMPYTGHGMVGFDNVSGKYWSTWNDSMSTGIMVSEGTCDSQGKTCTFTGSWNDAIKKTPVKARMTTRWTSPTTEVFEMYAPGKDGKEMKMMEITYTKQ